MADAEPIAARPTDLRTRVVVGVALGTVAAAALALGGIWFWAFIAAIALVVVGEWAGLARVGTWRAGLAVIALAVGLLLAAPMLWGTDRATVALIVALGIVVAAIVGNAMLGLGVAYVGVPAIGILFLRGQADGAALALWTLLIVILTDTGAFFAGRAIGGAKLAPRISPKKTWSGLAGGMIAAAIGGALVGGLAQLPPATMWLGAPLAVVAQMGDLYESWLKREAGVKDSGRLLPGHGGFLDRIDGAIPVVTIMSALVAGGVL